jgi:putative membrane protein
MAVLTVALAAPAIAQTGAKPTTGSDKPATMSAEKQSSGAVAPADKTFVHEAAVGGMAEVELGNLAKEKASSADVKQFGERMATDHGKANDELKQWAQKNNVTLPADVDAKHKALKDRLSKLSGDAFDKAYMREMVTDHQKDVAAFRKASQTAKNADLKAWAGQTLPTLEDHLKQARETASKVGAGAATTAKKK